MQFKYNYFYCLAFSHRKTWHGRPLVVLDTRRVDFFHIRKWWISDWWWQVYKITPGKWKMWEHPRVLMVRHTYTWVKLSSHTDAGSQVNRVKLGFCFLFFCWRVSVLKYLRHKLTFECYMTEVVIIIFWVYFFFKHRVFNQDFLQNKSMKNKWIRCWLYFFCSILTFRADTKKKNWLPWQHKQHCHLHQTDSVPTSLLLIKLMFTVHSPCSRVMPQEPEHLHNNGTTRLTKIKTL